jgi:hypothetical protein
MKMPGPTGGGGMNVDEKLAILIKSYELEPLPKLALEVGEKATVDLLHSGQYLGHLIRKMSLGFLGFNKEVELLDLNLAMLIRDDPVYGFSHYLVDHGVARVFGRELHEGKVPLEPAIGAASAIGIVEKDMDGTTKVYTKKQLGIKTETLRETAKRFYSVGTEPSRLGEVRTIENQPQKETIEYIKEEMEKKRKAEEAAIEPEWVQKKEESEDEEEQPRELDIALNPDIVGIEPDSDTMYPSWVDEAQLRRKEREEKNRIKEQKQIDKEYILPFDYDEEEGEQTEEEGEEEDDDYLVPF